jgi:hypothetical protein
MQTVSDQFKKIFTPAELEKEKSQLSMSRSSQMIEWEKLLKIQAEKIFGVWFNSHLPHQKDQIFSIFPSLHPLFINQPTVIKAHLH